MIPLNSFRHQYSRTRVALVALVFTVIIAALAFSSRDVSSQGGDPQRRDLDRVFSRHERLTLDPGQIQRQVKQTRSLTLTTSRGRFEMTLAPHDMRAPGYRAEAWGDNGAHVIETGPVRTYKGTVQGFPTAEARLTIDEDTVEGLIITPGELFFIEPAKRYSGSAAKTDFVFYAASDLKESAGECGTTMAEIVAEHSTNVSNATSKKGPQPEAIFGPEQQIAIALEADFEYFSVFGSEVATLNQINSIMNQVDGVIYKNQLGLRFSIVFTRVWTTAGDPYTSPTPPATISASTALEQFKDTYNDSTPAGAENRDIAHLFTNRNLASGASPSTIGIAYLPGLECPLDPADGFAYGISEHSTLNPAALTAHEIGHNLGATHVNSDQGSDCGGPGITSIMNPSISASQTFCQFSKDEITSHALAVRSCLTPLSSICANISPSSLDIPAAGGNGNVLVTAAGGCSWGVAEGVGWLSASTAGGTGDGAVGYTVSANSCGPRTTQISIGGQIHTVNQFGKANYLTDPATATPIAPFQTLNGELSSPDCPTGIEDPDDAPPIVRVNAFMDRYKFFGMAGQKIRIEMNSSTAPQDGGLDTYLYLYAPDGTQLEENDDLKVGDVTNSRIPCNVPCDVTPPEFLTLPQTGTYIIVATSYSSGDSGPYSLKLTSEPLLLTAQVTDSVGTAAAVNSVTFARTSDPTNQAFRIFDPYNFSADQTTRLILFTSDLGLIQQQNPDPGVMTVRAGGVELVVEHVGPFTFPGLNGSYVVVALKAKQSGQTMPTGSLVFTVSTAGGTQTSNAVTLTIAP